MESEALRLPLKGPGAQIRLLTFFDGFKDAVLLVFRIVPGGLLHIGLPCSNFIWMPRSVHRRADGFEWGDKAKASVKRANLILSRVCLLICTARRVLWFLEQNRSSIVPRIPIVATILSLETRILQGPKP